MRRVLLASAAVLGLVVAAPALAMNDHHGQVPEDGSAQAHTWNGSHDNNTSNPPAPTGGSTQGGSTQGGSSGGSGGGGWGHHDHSGTGGSGTTGAATGAGTTTG